MASEQKTVPPKRGPVKAKKSILRQTKSERKLCKGNMDYEYDSETMDDSKVYEKCKKWLPDSSSKSIIEFRKRYIENVLKLPSCECGHPAVIQTVAKKTSPNCGKEFYTCVCWPSNCTFFKWINQEDGDKSALYRKIKKAKITKKDMRTAYKRGWFGTTEEEPPIKRLRVKIESSGIKNEEFLEAKEMGLY
jgi:hypothetical protein